MFQQSGWLLIRAATDVPGTYRYAMTAPYYVDIGGQPRISRESAQFFLDWATERMDSLQFQSSGEREAVLKHHRKGIEFWKDRVALANAP